MQNFSRRRVTAHTVRWAIVSQALTLARFRRAVASQQLPTYIAGRPGAPLLAQPRCQSVLYRTDRPAVARQAVTS
jgi:hypothetical protein